MGLEPDATRIDSGNSDQERDTASLRSIAISMKRIADLMEATCGEDSRNEYGELPFEAIGSSIARALRT